MIVSQSKSLPRSLESSYQGGYSSYNNLAASKGSQPESSFDQGTTIKPDQFTSLRGGPADHHTLKRINFVAPNNVPQYSPAPSSTNSQILGYKSPSHLRGISFQDDISNFQPEGEYNRELRMNKQLPPRVYANHIPIEPSNPYMSSFGASMRSENMETPRDTRENAYITKINLDTQPKRDKNEGITKIALDSERSRDADVRSSAFYNSLFYGQDEGMRMSQSLQGQGLSVKDFSAEKGDFKGDYKGGREINISFENGENKSSAKGGAGGDKESVVCLSSYHGSTTRNWHAENNFEGDTSPVVERYSRIGSMKDETEEKLKARLVESRGVSEGPDFTESQNGGLKETIRSYQDTNNPLKSGSKRSQSDVIIQQNIEAYMNDSKKAKLMRQSSNDPDVEGDNLFSSRKQMVKTPEKFEEAALGDGKKARSLRVGPDLQGDSSFHATRTPDKIGEIYLNDSKKARELAQSRNDPDIEEDHLFNSKTPDKSFVMQRSHTGHSQSRLGRSYRSSAMKYSNNKAKSNPDLEYYSDSMVADSDIGYNVEENYPAITIQNIPTTNYQATRKAVPSDFSSGVQWHSMGFIEDNLTNKATQIPYNNSLSLEDLEDVPPNIATKQIATVHHSASFNKGNFEEQARGSRNFGASKANTLHGSLNSSTTSRLQESIGNERSYLVKDHPFISPHKSQQSISRSAGASFVGNIPEKAANNHHVNNPIAYDLPFNGGGQKRENIVVEDHQDHQRDWKSLETESSQRVFTATSNFEYDPEEEQHLSLFPESNMTPNKAEFEATNNHIASSFGLPQIEQGKSIQQAPAAEELEEEEVSQEELIKPIQEQPKSLDHIKEEYIDEVIIENQNRPAEVYYRQKGAEASPDAHEEMNTAGLAEREELAKKLRFQKLPRFMPDIIETEEDYEHSMMQHSETQRAKPVNNLGEELLEKIMKFKEMKAPSRKANEESKSQDKNTDLKKEAQEEYLKYLELKREKAIERKRSSLSDSQRKEEEKPAIKAIFFQEPEDHEVKPVVINVEKTPTNKLVNLEITQNKVISSKPPLVPEGKDDGIGSFLNGTHRSLKSVRSQVEEDQTVNTKESLDTSSPPPEFAVAHSIESKVSEPETIMKQEENLHDSASKPKAGLNKLIKNMYGTPPVSAKKEGRDKEKEKEQISSSFSNMLELMRKRARASEEESKNFTTETNEIQFTPEKNQTHQTEGSAPSRSVINLQAIPCKEIESINISGSLSDLPPHFQPKETPKAATIGQAEQKPVVIPQNTHKEDFKDVSQGLAMLKEKFAKKKNDSSQQQQKESQILTEHNETVETIKTDDSRSNRRDTLKRIEEMLSKSMTSPKAAAIQESSQTNIAKSFVNIPSNQNVNTQQQQQQRLGSSESTTSLGTIKKKEEKVSFLEALDNLIEKHKAKTGGNAHAPAPAKQIDLVSKIRNISLGSAVLESTAEVSTKNTLDSCKNIPSLDLTYEEKKQAGNKAANIFIDEMQKKTLKPSIKPSYKAGYSLENVGELSISDSQDTGTIQMSEETEKAVKSLVAAGKAQGQEKRSFLKTISDDHNKHLNTSEFTFISKREDSRESVESNMWIRSFLTPSNNATKKAEGEKKITFANSVKTENKEKPRFTFNSLSETLMKGGKSQSNQWAQAQAGYFLLFIFSI